MTGECCPASQIWNIIQVSTHGLRYCDRHCYNSLGSNIDQMNDDAN